MLQYNKDGAKPWCHAATMKGLLGRASVLTSALLSLLVAGQTTVIVQGTASHAIPETLCTFDSLMSLLHTQCFNRGIDVRRHQREFRLVHKNLM